MELKYTSKSASVLNTCLHLAQKLEIVKRTRKEEKNKGMDKDAKDDEDRETT